MDRRDGGEGRDYRRLMQEALLELESLQSQVDGLRRAQTEPIAIIGMGCRFPAGANHPEAFWRLLRDGVDAVREVPPDRWDVDAYYDPDADAPGKVYCRNAAMVDTALVEQFSPEFFGIAPREAERMDPQQRMLLEVCWEALENAAVPPERVRGSRTGLFVGSCTDDYLQLFNNLVDPARIDGYTSLGTARCITVGRVSYLLGLEGPAIQLDTACSSSLVAVHQACLSLRSGECDMALVGGVNLQLSPAWTIGLCKLKALAPDGRCRTFDASADGFGRGEGCGILVLKPLSAALAAGDRILAVVRGTAINHDGRSSGLTVPSQMAQEKLLREALRAARVQPDEIDYVEAHGTGTVLGDPVEMGALASVFDQRRQPLWVGSVKTNIGHLEAAAGVAGLMKIILALEHEAIPPNLHFRDPNPHIPWKEFPARVPTQLTPWPRGDRARLAGVSSFGFSGTNAHVIVEESPLRSAAASASRPVQVLVLSAKTPEALDALAGQYAACLEGDASLALSDVCYTAATGRASFAHRLAVIAETGPQAGRRLRAAARGEPCDGVYRGTVEKPAGAAAAMPQASGPSQPDGKDLADLAARAFVRGDAIDWESFYRDGRGRKVGLPTYPFQRQRYWLPRPAARSAQAAKSPQPSVHPLLGPRVHVVAASESVQFERRLMSENPAYLADHRVGETAIFPATAQLEMAIAAGRATRAGQGIVLEDVTFPRALTLAEGETRIVQTVVTPSPGGHRVELFSRDASTEDPASRPAWVRHASGIVKAAEPAGAAVSLEEWRRRCRENVSVEAVYHRIALQGLQYGPSFRLLKEAWRAAGQSLGRVVLPDEPHLAADEYSFHPAALDACLHVIAAMVETDGTRMVVPARLERLEILGRPGREIWTHATLRGGEGSKTPDAYTLDVDLVSPEGDLLARFVGLRLQQIDPSALACGADSDALLGLYEVGWHEVPHSDGARTSPQGRWLLLGDDLGLADLVAQRLSDQGQSCDVVRDEKDVSQRIGELAQGESLSGVVSLGALDVPPDEADAFAASHRACCGSVLALIQTLVAQSPRTRLWLVTRGAQSVLGSRLDVSALAQVPLWGLGRVAMLEHPELRATHVDLDPQADLGEQADALAAELLHPDAEGQIAWRQGRRLAARLVHAPNPEPRTIEMGEGSCLITGGLGELGLRVAQWLVDRGARHLVLSSRRGPETETQREILDRLRRRGAKVAVILADVSDRVEVERLLATVRRTMPPLRGVVHAAGVLDDGMIQGLDWPRFERVMRPKVAGAWHLHELAGELDFFVLFSSAVGLLGSSGQANYAAANAFLDALARYRTARGQPALSIAWGPWEIGMASRLEGRLRQRLARAGLRPIREPAGLRVLEQLWDQRTSHLAAISVDWSRLAATAFPSPFWAHLAPRSAAAAPPASLWLDSLQKTPSGNRMRMLTNLIRGEVAAVLGWNSAERVGTRQKLFDLGMDSLTSVELQTRMEKHLGCSLPLTLAFDHPNVESLAGYIIERLNLQAATHSPARKGSDENADDEKRLAEMSEQEVESLLAEKYKHLL